MPNTIPGKTKSPPGRQVHVRVLQPLGANGGGVSARAPTLVDSAHPCRPNNSVRSPVRGAVETRPTAQQAGPAYPKLTQFCEKHGLPGPGGGAASRPNAASIAVANGGSAQARYCAQQRKAAGLSMVGAAASSSTSTTRNLERPRGKVATPSSRSGAPSPRAEDVRRRPSPGFGPGPHQGGGRVAASKSAVGRQKGTLDALREVVKSVNHASLVVDPAVDEKEQFFVLVSAKPPSQVGHAVEARAEGRHPAFPDSCLPYEEIERALKLLPFAEIDRVLKLKRHTLQMELKVLNNLSFTQAVKRYRNDETTLQRLLLKYLVKRFLDDLEEKKKKKKTKTKQKELGEEAEAVDRGDDDGTEIVPDGSAVAHALVPTSTVTVTTKKAAPAERESPSPPTARGTAKFTTVRIPHHDVRRSGSGSQRNRSDTGHVFAWDEWEHRSSSSSSRSSDSTLRALPSSSDLTGDNEVSMADDESELAAVAAPAKAALLGKGNDTSDPFIRERVRHEACAPAGNPRPPLIDVSSNRKAARKGTPEKEKREAISNNVRHVALGGSRGGGSCATTSDSNRRDGHPSSSSVVPFSRSCPHPSSSTSKPAVSTTKKATPPPPPHRTVAVPARQQQGAAAQFRQPHPPPYALSSDRKVANKPSFVTLSKRFDNDTFLQSSTHVGTTSLHPAQPQLKAAPYVGGGGGPAHASTSASLMIDKVPIKTSSSPAGTQTCHPSPIVDVASSRSASPIPHGTTDAVKRMAMNSKVRQLALEGSKRGASWATSSSNSRRLLPPTANSYLAATTTSTSKAMASPPLARPSPAKMPAFGSPAAMKKLVPATAKKAVAWPALRPPQSPEPECNSYVMTDSEDEMSDDDDDGQSPKPKKYIPRWARPPLLQEALLRQFTDPAMDPELVFGDVSYVSVDLEEIFGSAQKERYRRRGSSGNWTKHGLTESEKENFRRQRRRETVILRFY